MVSAAEAVTIIEIGGGSYWATYTPTAAATIYRMRIAPVSSFQVAKAPDEGWQDEIQAVPISLSGPYLTTRDSYKLGFKRVLDEFDARIDQLLPVVTAEIERYCGIHFLQATYTEYPEIKGAPLRKVFLDNKPVVSVTSLHLSTTSPRVYDATTLLTEGVDFHLNEKRGTIEFVCRRLVRGPIEKVVKAVYVGGYATVPADIQRAAEEVLECKLSKAVGHLYHFTSESKSDGSIQGLRWEDFPPSTIKTLDDYRSRVAA